MTPTETGAGEPTPYCEHASTWCEVCASTEGARRPRTFEISGAVVCLMLCARCRRQTTTIPPRLSRQTLARLAGEHRDHVERTGRPADVVAVA